MPSMSQGKRVKELESVLLDVMYKTLLLIRHCPNLRVAQIAASHAHNLPRLIRAFDPKGLAHYWEMDRPYLESVANEEAISLGLLTETWDQLEHLYQSFCQDNHGR